jgi:hypothetical protein
LDFVAAHSDVAASILLLEVLVLSELRCAGLYIAFFVLLLDVVLYLPILLDQTPELLPLLLKLLLLIRGVLPKLVHPFPSIINSFSRLTTFEYDGVELSLLL